jgi:hypothetical protein
MKKQQPYGDIAPEDFEVLKRTIGIVRKERIAGSFVEVGVFKALTSRAISRVLEAEGDEWGEPEFVGVDISPRAEKRWEAMPKAPNISYRFLRMPSAKAARIYAHGCAWVFIDGCHCYDCVSNDIAAWGYKVTRGGFLVLHDTNTGEDVGKPHFCHVRNKKYGVGVLRAVENSLRLCKAFRLEHESLSRLGVRAYRRLADQNGPSKEPG